MLQVLNYGQSVFEGMKAQRSAKGRIVLFRPDQNAARMAAGAARLSMPAPPTDLFVGAVQQLVRDNQDYVPPQGKGSLYIRPLLMGSGGILGLGPAPSYTFAIFCAAVGAYFKVSPCLQHCGSFMHISCLCLLVSNSVIDQPVERLFAIAVHIAICQHDVYMCVYKRVCTQVMYTVHTHM